MQNNFGFIKSGKVSNPNGKPLRFNNITFSYSKHDRILKNRSEKQQSFIEGINED